LTGVFGRIEHVLASPQEVDCLKIRVVGRSGESPFHLVVPALSALLTTGFAPLGTVNAPEAMAFSKRLAWSLTARST
jgi:hypothetical protein